MMSAILDTAGHQNAVEAREATVSGGAFEANRAWELDRVVMLEKSERRGWLFGYAGFEVAEITAAARIVGQLARRLPRA